MPATLTRRRIGCVYPDHAGTHGSLVTLHQIEEAAIAKGLNNRVIVRRKQTHWSTGSI